MDFSSNLRTYSNILAKIITSQTPNGQCFYCKKKNGQCFYCKKKKKKKKKKKERAKIHQMNAVGFQTC